MSNNHEPQFYLKDELIYFLQKNAVISSTLIHVIDNYSGGNRFKIITGLEIAGKEICSTTSNELTIPLHEDKLISSLETEVGNLKHDVKNLIHHLLEQQKKIETLELEIRLDKTI